MSQTVEEYRASQNAVATPAIVIALYAIAGIAILAGGLMVYAGASDERTFEIGMGASSALAGVLLVAFSAALDRLHKIEHHLRNRTPL